MFLIESMSEIISHRGVIKHANKKTQIERNKSNCLIQNFIFKIHNLKIL